ncbi:MAG: OsmC family protein [Saprospiraceae bacterium]
MSVLQNMQVELKRIDDAFHLEATNETGNTTHTDGSPKIGGGNNAFRPMQMVLAAVGGCSSIDVISILKKQRQPLDDIKISVTGERDPDAVPSIFTDIHVHYKLYGELNKSKAERAIRLSMDKYCSVSKMLEKVADITWSYEINDVAQEKEV